MASFVFYWTVLKVAPIMFFNYVPCANKMIADKATYSEADRFNMTKKIINHIRKSGHIETKVYGKENIPSDRNFILYANHQDKYDALGIILSVTKPIGMLWAKATAGQPLCKQVVGLTDSVVIPLDDHRGIVLAIREAITAVNNGKNLLIFPEGGYTNNHNNFQKFGYGCFSISVKTKTPIVPVVLYDSYKGFGVMRFKKAHTEVHYLKPIMPEEYEGMTKTELGQLVESRMLDKMNELKALKGEG